MAYSRSICNRSSAFLVSIPLIKLNQTPIVLQLECKKVSVDYMQMATKSKISSKSLIFKTVGSNFVYKVNKTYSMIFLQFYLLLFSHFSWKVVLTFPQVLERVWNIWIAFTGLQHYLTKNQHMHLLVMGPNQNFQGLII